MVCQNPLELDDKVYDTFNANMQNAVYLQHQAIISSINDTIQERNYEFIKRLLGDIEISYSRDSCVENDNQMLFEPEFLNRVNISGIPHHRLSLKKGS